MLAKVILVMYILGGRSDVRVQYIVRFPTESQCQAEAAKYVQKRWEQFPVNRAECVFDATQGVK